MNAETRAKYRNAPVTQYIDCALNPVYTPMPWPPLKNTMEPFVSVKPEHLKDLLDAADDRDRYLALLQEIATVEDHAERCEKFHAHYHYSRESIQRHVRQQLEKWEAKIDG